MSIFHILLVVRLSSSVKVSFRLISYHLRNATFILPLGRMAYLILHWMSSIT